jgi:hypothetical protein
MTVSQCDFAQQYDFNLEVIPTTAKAFNLLFHKPVDGIFIEGLQ